MKAAVVNYRGSYKTHRAKHMVLKPEGVDTKADAAKLVGKEAIWVSPSGKELKGKISGPHGAKGCVRAQFLEAGLPGQSLGTKVEIK